MRQPSNNDAHLPRKVATAYSVDNPAHAADHLTH